MANKFNLEIDGKFKSTTKGNADWYYGGGNEAWSSISAAKEGVVGTIRTGKIVGVIEDGKIVEYIWHPEDITNDGLVLSVAKGFENVSFDNTELETLYYTSDLDNPVTAEWDLSPDPQRPWTQETGTGELVSFPVQLHDTTSSAILTVNTLSDINILKFDLQQFAELQYDGLQLFDNNVLVHTAFEIADNNYHTRELVLFGALEHKLEFRMITDGGTVVAPYHIRIKNIRLFSYSISSTIKSGIKAFGNTIFNKDLGVAGVFTALGDSRFVGKLYAPTVEITDIMSAKRIEQHVTRYLAGNGNEKVLQQARVSVDYDGTVNSGSAKLVVRNVISNIGAFGVDPSLTNRPYYAIAFNDGGWRSVINFGPKETCQSNLASKLRVGFNGVDHSDKNALSVNGTVKATKFIGDGSELTGLNLDQSVPSWKVVFPGGFGKYPNGAIVPANTSQHEQTKEAFTVFSSANFVLPLNNYIADSFVETEVGTMVDRTFSNDFSQNDGGSIISQKIFKDNVEVAAVGTFSENIALTFVPISYRGEVSYGAGTVQKENSIGVLEDNTIIAGVAISVSKTIRGYNPVFFGSAATKKTTSSQIRSLNKRLTNTGNVWELSTGTTHKIFQIWLPNDKSLVSINDLDVFGTDVTTSYVAEAKTINDIGGDPVVGTLYTRTADVPYGSSHRHKITTS